MKLDFFLTEERMRIGDTALSASPLFAWDRLAFPDCDFVSYALLRGGDLLPAQGEELCGRLRRSFPSMSFAIRNGFLQCRIDSAFLAERLEAFRRGERGACCQKEIPAQTQETGGFSTGGDAPFSPETPAQMSEASDFATGRDAPFSPETPAQIREAAGQREKVSTEPGFYTEYGKNRIRTLLREFDPKQTPAGGQALALLAEKNQAVRTAILLILSAEGLLSASLPGDDGEPAACFRSAGSRARLQETVAKLFYLYDRARQSAAEICPLYYRAVLAFLTGG